MFSASCTSSIVWGGGLGAEGGAGNVSMRIVSLPWKSLPARKEKLARGIFLERNREMIYFTTDSEMLSDCLRAHSYFERGA